MRVWSLSRLAFYKNLQRTQTESIYFNPMPSSAEVQGDIGNLKEAIKRSSEIMPPHIRDAMQKTLGQKFLTPSASSLCRANLTLDATLIRLQRDIYRDLNLCCYFWADSSPQVGHDWLIVQCLQIATRDLASSLCASNFLARGGKSGTAAAMLDAILDANATDSREETARQFFCDWSQAEETIRNNLRIHTQMPVQLGAKARWS